MTTQSLPEDTHRQVRGDTSGLREDRAGGQRRGLPPRLALNSLGQPREIRMIRVRLDLTPWLAAMRLRLGAQQAQL